MVNGINNITTTQTNSSTSTTTSSSTSSTSANSNNTINKNDFMNLLITQMKNQDPLSPMDGTQFAAQLAQFSSLEQLQNLNTSMTQSINANLALTQSINNTLSATLIGKEVKLSGSNITYSGQNSVQLGYTLPSNASSVSLKIYDSNGNLVKTIDNLPTDTSDNKLTWDFTDNNGNKVQQGNYTFEVDATSASGKDITPDIYKYGVIDGVKYTSSGTKLLVDNSEYNLSDVTEIINQP